MCLLEMAAGDVAIGSLVYYGKLALNATSRTIASPPYRRLRIALQTPPRFSATSFVSPPSWAAAGYAGHTPSSIRGRGPPPQIQNVNGVRIEIDLEKDAVAANPSPPDQGALQPHNVPGERVLRERLYRRGDLLSITSGKF